MERAGFYRVCSDPDKSTGIFTDASWHPLWSILFVMLVFCITTVVHKLQGAARWYGWVRMGTEMYGDMRRRKRPVSLNHQIPRFSLKVKGGLGESENLLFS